MPHHRGSLFGVRRLRGVRMLKRHKCRAPAAFCPLSNCIVPRIGIGKNTRIENAIIDKNARIGENCVISPAGKPDNMDHALFYIRDGIVIIPKNGIIPHGTVL